MENDIKLWHGDCLELMNDIPDKSVDMVLCDLPYGTTHCEWDIPLPLEPLWEQYKRVVKENGAICLFAQQPFQTDLIQSNRKMFRYEWVWEKTMPLGFLNANRMLLRAHENICVFYRRLPTYNPQKTFGGGSPVGETTEVTDSVVTGSTKQWMIRGTMGRDTRKT